MNYKGLYDVNYKTLLGRPYVFLFIRNEDGTKEVKTITDFRPYIYINPEDIDAINENEYLSQKIHEISDKFYKTIFGKDVAKVTLKTPSDTYYIRQVLGLSQTYEADILFSLRYCIDEIGEVESTKYKILYFDIETDTEHGFSTKEDPTEPIISISAYDNYSEKIVTFVWRADQEGRKEGDIYYYDNEEEMLQGFLYYWKHQDVDIITAWNLGFDIGYLVARLRELGMSTEKLGEVKVRENKEVEIFGKVMFDLLKGYRKMHFGELKSYALGNIAQDELGDKKEKVYNTGDVWRKDLAKLISYNRKDVELIYKIDNKCKLVSIFDDIKRFAGVRNINDCFFASRIHETKIMKKYRNVVFPNKPPFVEKSEETMIKGAFVKEPIPGLYHNVICIDAKSLYPSIIYTFNLSTEMVDDSGMQINRIKVKQSPKGIMPSMIKELIELKDEMKKKVAGTGQNISDKMFAIKTFINSFYGVNALTSFRLYNKEIAENITFLGREITQKCSELVEKEFGYKVVYNDTDSLFINLGKKEKNIIEIGKKIEKYLDVNINKIVQDKYQVVDSTIHMEFEKVYESIILQKKKRYAGRVIWEDGEEKDKITIAGMAARRSDTPEISKIMQTNLFDMILKGKTKDYCVGYVTGLILNMINGGISIEDIAQPVKLNMDIEKYKIQNTPKIRGVKWSNENLGTSFKTGTKFKMIYVEHPETNVVCFEEEEQIKDLVIDYKLQLEKCVFQKIKPIFETLGWDDDYLYLQTYSKNKLTEPTDKT